ncbi:MAG: sensor histidine kinase, partial [Bacteroidetes bacterium]
MNIYRKKQIWKYLLAIFGLLIIIISFWYTNQIARKIAEDERKKVQLWAEAVKNKSRLVEITNRLFKELADEERKKVELWAEATKLLASENTQTDIGFLLKVVSNNTTVPVILTNQNLKIISYRNIADSIVKNQNLLQKKLENMKQKNPPIEIIIDKQHKNFIFYEDSRLFTELKNVMNELINSFISEVVVNAAAVPVILTDSTRQNIIAYGNINPGKLNSPEKVNRLLQEMENANPPLKIHLLNKTHWVFYQNSELLSKLTYYPVFQLFVIIIFILSAYWLFSIARNAEQDLVWVGLAKETAHQLGTPISSLMAWIEILKDKYPDENSFQEMEKDIVRLNTITERFSKIGSAPEVEKVNLNEFITQNINYLKRRSSKKIQFIVNIPPDIEVQINRPLFQWVIENLVKNAIDAMNGNGKIQIEAFREN